jgi:hypothetical protein
MVMSLTDGYSDIDRIVGDYNWIRNNIPLTFIITKNGTIPNTKNSIGNIMNIKMN